VIFTLVLVSACAVRAASTATPVPAGPALSLDAYLEQVRAENLAFHESDETQRALPLQADEPAVILSPRLDAQGGFTDSRKEPATSLSPPRTIGSRWNVGVSKLFDTGTNVAFNYGLDYTRLFPPAVPAGLPPAIAAGFFASQPYFDAAPSLTVSQSLLRDWRGGNTRAGILKVRAQAAAAVAAERMRQHQLILQAEQAYWNVSLAQELLDAAKSSRDRTERFVGWTRRKAALNLAESSDLAQAEAGGELRALAVRAAEQDLTAARRTLNALRNQNGDVVPEKIIRLAAQIAEGGPEIRPDGARLDIAIAEHALAAAEHATRMSSFRSMPELSAFGTLAFNGHDTSGGDAVTKSFGAQHTAWTVGAAFTMPLDLRFLAHVHAGYEAAERAAQLDVERARTAAARDWEALRQRLADVDSRLKLARRIEQAQRNKLEIETRRNRQGRSTLFQLLAFEEDVSQAQLTRLRFEYERLLLAAQARFYNGR